MQDGQKVRLGIFHEGIGEPLLAHAGLTVDTDRFTKYFESIQLASRIQFFRFFNFN
jgi:hypothetical protein